MDNHDVHTCPYNPPPGIRGLLLLDVDGPLNPYNAKAWRRPDGYRSYRHTRDGRWYSGRDFRRHKGMRVWLNPEHGHQILELAADTKLQPVWATSWLGNANKLVSPAIGLPSLPVIDFPAEDLDRSGNAAWLAEGRWKYGGISSFVGHLPLAWLDDEHDLQVTLADEPPGPRREQLSHYRSHARETFLHGRGDTPTLLCQVDPRTGVDGKHLNQIRSWANTLPDGDRRSVA